MEKKDDLNCLRKEYEEEHGIAEDKDGSTRFYPVIFRPNPSPKTVL